MPTLTTVSTLLDAVMNELRIPVTNTTERAKIQTVMGLVYADICAKQDWWWLLKRYASALNGATSLPAANPDITMSVTEFSDTATLSSTPGGTITLANQSIWFSGAGDTAQDVYRVTSTYTFPATTLRLDSIYGGPTASGLSFVAYQDIYALPQDCAKVLRVSRYGNPYDMPKIGIEEMSQIKQWDKSVGPPQVWSVYDHLETGDPSSVRLLQIHPYPDASYKYEVWYKKQNLADTTDIDLPVDFQQVLLYGTLSRCYPVFMNDLERGAYYLSLFNDVMALMAAQQREYASSKPGINPSASLYRNTPTRSGRGRWGYNLGPSLFDRFPYNP